MTGGSTLPVAVDTNKGSAAIDLGTSAGSILGGSGNTVITIPSISGVKSYTAEIPASSLSGSGTGSLTLSTGAGSVTIPGNMLSGTGLIGNAGVSISESDKSNLPDDVKAAIGNRPVIQLSLTVDGQQTNGRYDPETGTVTFKTTHFSLYAVGYNEAAFRDVPQNAWYHDAVAFIAARGITTGTGDGNFSSESKLTRGQFIVMLMKAYDIAPDKNPTDNFADGGSTYYTGYLAAVKRFGISNGIGNNMFAPEKEISRQEMFTPLYNALKVIGKLPEGTAGKSLTDFSDAGQVASWAKDAMTLFVQTGTVGGNSGKLSPPQARPPERRWRRRFSTCCQNKEYGARVLPPICGSRPVKIKYALTKRD